jgi:hypothetical protein
MHHINQLRPQGAGKDYANGAYNCGPAVVAMLARASGRMGHLNDAQLIQQLGKGLVTRQGTSPEGITRMLERADVPLAGKALGAGYNDADLKEHLLKGHKLIAQVRSSNPQSQKDSAHYVVIEGMTRDGDYLISDPLSNKPYTVSPRKLKEAVLKAPPDGGMLIPVAGPSQAKRSAAQDMAVASGGGASARRTDAFVGPAAAPAPATINKRTDTFEMAALSVPAAQRQAPAVATAPAAPALAAPVPARAAPAPLLIEPAVAESLTVPEEKAFTATEEVFEGVDTNFQETDSQPTDVRMARNQERNKFDLDVHYGRGRGPDEEPKRAVTSDNLNLGEFIQNLIQLKASGDEKAYQTLSDLEASSSEQDKQVLKEIKQSDKKDPGIGVKTMGDPF